MKLLHVYMFSLMTVRFVDNNRQETAMMCCRFGSMYLYMFKESKICLD